MLTKIRDKISAKTDQQGRIILGQGGFGAVYLVEYNKTLAAMKQIIPHKANEEHAARDFQKECELLRTVRHPNVIFFLGACLKPDNMLFLTEYMEHGDLFSLIAKKDNNISWENYGKDIALQIALGLNHLHSNKVIHRDIKSLNVLIGRGYVAKISDVGLAKTKTQTATALTTGNRSMTLLWASPEQMDIDQTVSFPSDIFR
jgi:serine/threonine protein kinase